MTRGKELDELCPDDKWPCWPAVLGSWVSLMTRGLHDCEAPLQDYSLTSLKAGRAEDGKLWVWVNFSTNFSNNKKGATTPPK